MAVIREVRRLVHYNMDVSEEELLALLACIRFRKTYLAKTPSDPHKAAMVQLTLQIEGALKHG